MTLSGSNHVKSPLFVHFGLLFLSRLFLELAKLVFEFSKYYLQMTIHHEQNMVRVTPPICKFMDTVHI